MPGTGIHGYTGPSLYGGSYNISNGIIQSGSGATSSGTASRNSPYGKGNSIANTISDIGQNVANAVTNSNYNLASKAASGIASLAGSDSSDYGDYIREMLDVSANNTAQSQAFAREQMEYQRKSDENAMAWSAAEAQKNRDWQERLSNTAHQREVEDLLAAGLNPILAANGGAYTGSGATGQAFSSSGAMGNVDTTASSMIGSLFNTIINTASQAAIAGMYTDATRYSSDMQYAASKYATEGSIYNNNNSVTAQKEIANLNRDANITMSNISAAATRAAAGTTAGAMRYSSDNALAASKYAAQESRKASQYNANSNFNAATYTADRHYQGTQYSTDNGSIYSVGGMKGAANAILDVGNIGLAMLNSIWQ